LPKRWASSSAGRVLKVDQVHVIRHKVLVERRSARKVAKELGISRRTVRKRRAGPPPRGLSLTMSFRRFPAGRLRPKKRGRAGLNAASNFLVAGARNQRYLQLSRVAA